MAKAPKKPLVFVSHIHEEKELGLLFQERLKDEFSGYADVFVSSDEHSIPSGADFLTHIIDALNHCCAAIYLVSPVSIKRPWISFELGAVWLRSKNAVRAGKPHLPTIPICHSGMLLSDLRVPMSILNGIQANDANSLRRVFQDLQIATGGGGATLKTDFAKLASELSAFESRYTVGDKLVEFLCVLMPREAIPNFVKPLLSEGMDPERAIQTEPRWVEESVANKLRDLASTSALKGSIAVNATGTREGLNGVNVLNEVKLLIRIKCGLITAHRETLLGLK